MLSTCSLSHSLWMSGLSYLLRPTDSQAPVDVSPMTGQPMPAVAAVKFSSPHFGTSTQKANLFFHWDSLTTFPSSITNTAQPCLTVSRAHTWASFRHFLFVFIIRRSSWMPAWTFALFLRFVTAGLTLWGTAATVPVWGNVYPTTHILIIVHLYIHATLRTYLVFGIRYFFGGSNHVGVQATHNTLWSHEKKNNRGRPHFVVQAN